MRVETGSTKQISVSVDAFVKRPLSRDNEGHFITNWYKSVYPLGFAEEVHDFHTKTTKNSFVVIGGFVYPIVDIKELSQRFWDKNYHLSYVFMVMQSFAVSVEIGNVTIDTKTRWLIPDNMISDVIIVEDNPDNNNWIDEKFYGKKAEEHV